MLKDLFVSDFEPLIESDFRLWAANEELTLRLAEVRRLGQALREEGAFSLLFVSPPGPFLQQGMYPLTHADLGTLDIFIVPIGALASGNGYEAVFT
jgi:hypothetical protein